MLIRLNTLTKLTEGEYRLAVDVIDPDGGEWGSGDCVMRVDLRDEPTHRSAPRGPLRLAFETYTLSPDEPPAAAESQLLWKIGQAVYRYVDALFGSRVLCPFNGEAAPADTQGRPDSPAA